MVLSPLEQFYEKLEEPTKSCLLYLRQYLLESDEDITEAWKYRLPMFLYNGKMLCYFWFDKQNKMPYIGLMKGKFLNHPKLDQGNRKTVKAYHINPNEDLYIEEIQGLILESKKYFR